MNIKIKFMKLFIIIFTTIFLSNAWALKPLDGIILGDIKSDDAFDPLDNVFDARYNTLDSSDAGVVYREQLKFYTGFHDEGENLKNSCDQVNQSIVYSTPNQEYEAVQSIYANLQYIGLDLTTRAIGKYAKLTNTDEDSYVNLVNNLINNHCSKNISVVSLRTLKKNLLEKYFGNNNFNIPSIAENPYYPKALRLKLETSRNLKKEFALTVKNFITLCSWGADVDYPRMLVPFIQNPYIMSFIFRNMEGHKLIWSELDKTIRKVSVPNRIHVLCQNMICRNTTKDNFYRNFPRMVGSASLTNDFQRLYCNKFNKVDFVYEEVENKINDMIDLVYMDEIKLEQLNFTALLTSVPDLLINAQDYKDLISDLKSSIEERWTEWAVESTGRFSQDLLYEEQVKVLLQPRDTFDHRTRRGEFKIEFDIVQGEIDQALDSFNKLDVHFNLYFSKDFVRWTRSKWNELINKQDQELKSDFKKLVKNYVSGQLDLQNDYFLVSPLSDKVRDALVEELIAQFRSYEGRELENFNNKKMITVPVYFNYGMFALKYFRYQFKTLYRQQKSGLTSQK